MLLALEAIVFILLCLAVTAWAIIASYYTVKNRGQR